jgi:hypothetical protein
MTLWKTILAWLASMAADPHELDREPVRSYAAVSGAYATFAPVDPEPAPQPQPGPEACPCGGKCVDGKYQPDGRIWQNCMQNCKSCKAKSVLAPAAPASTQAKPCPTGKCPPPTAARGG